MLIKARSFASILLSASFVAGLAIIGVAPGSFAVSTGIPRQQILPNIQDANTSTLIPVSWLQVQYQQHTQLSEMKLHLVKITSPKKGQQVPIGQALTISGISSDTSKTSNCKVSVMVNGNKPYRVAYPAGQAGEGDYSKWNFTLTPSYTGIKEGQNKITAKFSCDNDPNILSHNSVNVTGVSRTLSYADQQQLQYTGKNLIDKKQLIDNSTNVDHSHPLSIIAIPQIHSPNTNIPFHLPFH